MATRDARLRRVAEALAELASGNYAHRVILPGDDVAARLAHQVNALADRIQSEHEAARTRDESRRRLVADISHDLRTPITSIAGYVDALQRGLGDEPERYLAVLSQKTAELAQLTDDLFYSARIDSGEFVLARAPLDLAEEARRSVLGFEPQLTARGVSVEVDVAEAGCVVQADRSAVGRILSNLISNALHHGEAMTRLRVVVQSAGDAVAVTVHNDGSRLPESGERLFERGAAGSAGGAGLGLSIARDLARRMRGDVTLDSVPSGQAAFTLTLPRET